MNAEAESATDIEKITNTALLNNSGEVVILEKSSTTADAAAGVVVSDVTDEQAVEIGTVINLSIDFGTATSTTSAAIIFTLDGSDPTLDNSTVYSEGIVINDHTTVKARVQDNAKYGEIATFNYRILQVENVTSSVEAGTVTPGTLVELSSSTTGSAIFYEIIEDDFTNSTTSQAIEYSGPIEIDRSRTIRTWAEKPGFKKSEVMEFNYVIDDTIVIIRDNEAVIRAGEYTEFPLKVRNKLTEEKEVSLVIAVYDEEDRMIDYLYIWDKLIPGESTEIEGGLRIADEAVYIKSYIVDSLEGIKPVSNTIKMPVVK